MDDTTSICPQSDDPSHHLHAPTNPQPIPTPTQHLLRELAAGAVNSFVHPLETSDVDVLLNQYWRAKATGCQTPSDFALDDSSLPARWKHAGWSAIRRKIWMSLVRTQQSVSRVQAFARCGSEAWIMQNNASPEKFKVCSSCCHDRFCTPCAVARSFELHACLKEQIGGKPITFLTLTLKHNGEKLTDLIDKLYHDFRLLRQIKLWERKVHGGAAFLEVVRDDKNAGWHPHLHIIMDAEYVPFDELQSAWRGITGGSFYLKIERVHQTGSVAGYVTKYVTKSLNSSFLKNDAWLDEAVEAMKGRRMCLCFGNWYGTPLQFAADMNLANDLDDVAGWTRVCNLRDLLEPAYEGDRECFNRLRSMGLAHKFHFLLAIGDSS